MKGTNALKVIVLSGLIVVGATMSSRAGDPDYSAAGTFVQEVIKLIADAGEMAMNATRLGGNALVSVLD